MAGWLGVIDRRWLLLSLEVLGDSPVGGCSWSSIYIFRSSPTNVYFSNGNSYAKSPNLLIY